MFNPKERLEQIRKGKSVKEDLAAYPQAPPLFQSTQPPPQIDQQQLLSRLSKLQNTVNELSTQLTSSKQVVSTLRRENSDLQTKLLKLQYENSQLKVTNRGYSQKAQSVRREKIDSTRKDKAQSIRREVDTSKGSRLDREGSAIRRVDSRSSEAIESILPEVEESIQQIRKQPLQNILHRKQKNFRALRMDPRQMVAGNKMLKQFASICKDYGKSLKKPVLVLKLQAQDFE